MSARVIHVDFAAWADSEPSQRKVCGARGYVVRRNERSQSLPLFAPRAPRTSTCDDERTLPGMTAWLDTHLRGPHR